MAVLTKENVLWTTPHIFMSAEMMASDTCMHYTTKHYLWFDVTVLNVGMVETGNGCRNFSQDTRLHTTFKRDHALFWKSRRSLATLIHSRHT